MISRLKTWSSAEQKFNGRIGRVDRRLDIFTNGFRTGIHPCWRSYMLNSIVSSSEWRLCYHFSRLVQNIGRWSLRLLSVCLWSNYEFENHSCACIGVWYPTITSWTLNKIREFCPSNGKWHIGAKVLWGILDIGIQRCECSCDFQTTSNSSCRWNIHLFENC